MRQLKITQSITSLDSIALSRYMQDIAQIDLLTPEEEIGLSQRIAAGDDQALHHLVNANLRFVISVAKQYQNQGLSLPDLINEGNIGLLKAARRFDHTKGFRFISYAVWWIRQSIMQAIIEYSRMVRLPSNKMQEAFQVHQKKLEFYQEFQREPSPKELSELLDISLKNVKLAIKHNQVTMSTDQPVHEDSAGTMLQLIMDESLPSPDHEVLDENTTKVIAALIRYLPPIEQKVIILSFGLDDQDALTYEEIAQTLNVSRERVRQLRERALLRLKKRIEIKNLQFY